MTNIPSLSRPRSPTFENLFDVRELRYLPQCWRVDIGSRGKHWHVLSSVSFEEEQQVGCCREGEMYLVRLPSDPPRPTQAREGVATNGWLAWKVEFSSSSRFSNLTRQSASSSLEPRVNNPPSASVVYISVVISTFRLHLRLASPTKEIA